MSYGPSDGGKGSKPRPFSISQDEYDNRWNAIFQRDIKKDEEVEDADPSNRSWYYDNEGNKRKKSPEGDDEDLNSKEVKIKATIPDIKIKGSTN